MKRIVLACSGGPRSAAAVRRLAGTFDGEIIAMTLDLGQRQALEEARDRALAAGATRAHVLDARQEFGRDYVIPSLKAQALKGAAAGHGFPAPVALSRPLIARKLVEIAAIEQASAVAHAEEGADRSPLAAALRGLNAPIEVIAAAPGLPEASAHVEENLWGRSFDAGRNAGDGSSVPPDVYTLTRAPRECPSEPACVDILFERGVPAAINGVSMPFVELIGNLTLIAGAHGIGRDPRGEAPAAAVLHAAHAELQNLVMTEDAHAFARRIGEEYGAIVRDGRWFTHRREELDALVDILQEMVSGTVRLKLFKGGIEVGQEGQVGRVGQEGRVEAR